MINCAPYICLLVYTGKITNVANNAVSHFFHLNDNDNKIIKEKKQLASFSMNKQSQEFKFSSASNVKMFIYLFH